MGQHILEIIEYVFKRWYRASDMILYSRKMDYISYALLESTRTQRFLKTNQVLSYWYWLDSSHWVLSNEYPLLPMCQGFSYESGVLHHFVLAKLATSSIRVKCNSQGSYMTYDRLDLFAKPKTHISPLHVPPLIWMEFVRRVLNNWSHVLRQLAHT